MKKKKFYIPLLCLAAVAIIAGIVLWRTKESLPSVVGTWVWDNGTAAAERTQCSILPRPTM